MIAMNNFGQMLIDNANISRAKGITAKPMKNIYKSKM
jgi:hypothetical protein